MNFSLIIFGKLLKVISLPASWIIYGDHALLVMYYYYTGIHFPEVIWLNTSYELSMWVTSYKLQVEILKVRVEI